ncbi:type VI secretion system tip protein TssI/VgrG [Utexia brackfieldae]|uniref:type VI secretion system Vgr family protein n=1 Tax=Utexia brackfieldae TaxID=3074108 RepID=UPI00370D367E
MIKAKPYTSMASAAGVAGSVKSALVNSADKTGLYFSIQIGELPLDTFDVVEFTLSEGLSDLFTLTATLSSKNANVDLQPQLLQKAQLTVYVAGQKQRTVNGIVETAERGDSGFKRTFYTFIIRPLLWQLTLTQDSRIYHFKSVPEIIDEILQLFNIPFDKKLMDSHAMREYTTMKRESYYAFLSRLTAEEGITFWFEEDKLFYSDSHLGMTAGISLIYNPHPQAAHQHPVISALTYACSMRPTKAKVKDYRYSHPDVTMDAKSIAAKSLPTFEVYDSYGRYEDEQTAQQFSQYRLDALQADSETGQAVSNCMLLMPGKIFSLTEHPTQSMNNRWQVVRITHHGTLPQSLDNERDDRPASLTNQFSFIPGKNEWRPPFIHKPLADGEEIAMVVGPAGEEIFVNEDGAVKVHFHWNRYDEADENASCWVRVVQNWNGDGFGFLSIPRIGQEVLVGYINGDIDRPIIMGTTYNGNNRPPLNLPAAKTQMSIKSKTHKGQGFNEMRFEDDAGKEGMFLHAQKDMDTTVLNNRMTNVKANHTETIGANQTINIAQNQNLKISANHNLAIQNASMTLVGGSSQLQVKGMVKIASATGIRFDCGAAAIEINSNGSIALICNKFSLFAKDLVEITGQKLIELNSDSAAAALKEEPVASNIEQALSETFITKNS